jgi:hypothetical protein
MGEGAYVMSSPMRVIPAMMCPHRIQFLPRTERVESKRRDLSVVCAKRPLITEDTLSARAMIPFGEGHAPNTLDDYDDEQP